MVPSVNYIVFMDVWSFMWYLSYPSEALCLVSWLLEIRCC
jgi:hypothetical protein